MKMMEKEQPKKKEEEQQQKEEDKLFVAIVRMVEFHSQRNQTKKQSESRATATATTTKELWLYDGISMNIHGVDLIISKYIKAMTWYVI